MYYILQEIYFLIIKMELAAASVVDD